jgi:hypothetical protein
LLLAGCATFSPQLRDIYRADGLLAASSGPTALALVGGAGNPHGAAGRLTAAPGAPVLALVGDVGEPHARAEPLVRRLAARVAGAPGAPVLALGDLFYSFGLLGTCPADGDRSRRRCEQPGTPEQQFDAVFAPYREALPENPLIGIAGNHDHYGGEAATRNACRLLPTGGAGWRYLAWGCGLDAERPLETLLAGPLAVVLLDSERMIRDSGFRRASVEALRTELARLRAERPERWIAVAAHHPLESYGAHNGGRLSAAVNKDLYWLRSTVLLPLSLAVEHWVVPWVGQQDVYEWRYRAFRRGLYRVFREQPIELFLSGHDHSLQLIEIEHPGVRYQVISGAGAKKTPVKRLGLDLLWTNRLARLVGLRDAVPAPKHRLRFAAGRDGAEDRSGYGYAVLVPSERGLVVEFYDAVLDAPLYVAELALRPRAAGPLGDED